MQTFLDMLFRLLDFILGSFSLASCNSKRPTYIASLVISLSSKRPDYNLKYFGFKRLRFEGFRFNLFQIFGCSFGLSHCYCTIAVRKFMVFVTT